ncbi:MAG TPA: hypothetical protein VE871_10310 [Longimicrobium sp.]|nr:hypothetical protein [Longimicrobium sp.]
MNKLKLHLDDLSVESFDTVKMEEAKGTVVGEQCTCPGVNTCDFTCDDATCVGSCQTCSPSCWDTCRPRQCYGTGTSA